MKLHTQKYLSISTVSLLTISLPAIILATTVNAADFNPQGFALTQLNTPEGFTGGVAFDINNNGVVVGRSRKNTDFVERAILWNTAGIGAELLGHQGFSDNNGVAKAINDTGQVVGSADKAATIWTDGINSIGTDLRNISTLKDINDSGFSISNTALLDNNQEPTTLSGIYDELGSLRSETIALNNNNSIIGTIGLRKSRYIAAPVINPILIKDNNFNLLGTLPNFEGGDARPSDINDNEQIVGVSYEGNATYGGLTNNLKSYAVIWQNDLIASLGTLGGTKSSAVKINNQGQIIGNSTDANGINHAFIWQNDGMYDLSAALCNIPSSCITNVRAINDNGEIVASVQESSIQKLVKLSFDDGALNNLPSIYSPLNFVVPAGAQVGNGTPLEGADISVSLKEPIIKRLSKRRFEVSYSSLFKNSGPKQAKNLVSTFSVSGKLNLVKVFTNAGSCETTVNGSNKNRTVTVSCQHGDLNPGQTFSRTVVVKAKKLRRLKAADAIESETNDPDESNNSISLKGIR